MEFITLFRTQHTWETLLSQSQSIRVKYANRIPVIVDRFNTQLPYLKKNKFLVPLDATVGQLAHVIRTHLKPKLHENEAIYLFLREYVYITSSEMFVNNSLPIFTMTMSQLYKQSQDRDGFLYFVYNKESTFGGEAEETQETQETQEIQL